MAQHVAFLRAINVGGKGLVKMTDLQKAFASAGCRNVGTFIASGNVVFEAANCDVVAKKLRTRLRRLLDPEPGVVFRTIPEMERLVKRAPFAKFAGERTWKFYVTFLAEKPAAKPRLPLVSDKEQLEVIEIRDRYALVVSRPIPGRRMYGFPNNFVEHELAVVATTRTWWTVTKVVEFARRSLQ